MSTIIYGNYITDGKKVYTLDSISNGGSGNSGSNDDFQALEKRVTQLEEDFEYAEGSEGNVLKYQVVSNTDGNPKIVEYEDTGIHKFLGQPFENAIEGIEIITQRFKQFNKDFCDSLINYIKTQQQIPWFDKTTDENGEITYTFNEEKFKKSVLLFLDNETGIEMKYSTYNRQTSEIVTSETKVSQDLFAILTFMADSITTTSEQASKEIKQNAYNIEQLGNLIQNSNNVSGLSQEVSDLKQGLQNIVGYTDSLGNVVEGTINKRIREKLDEFSKSSDFDLSFIKDELYGQDNNGLISDVKKFITNIKDGISFDEEIKAKVLFSGGTACKRCETTYTFKNVVDSIKTIIEWLKRLTGQSTENARFMHSHKDFIVKLLDIKPSCPYGNEYVSRTIKSLTDRIAKLEENKNNNIPQEGDQNTNDSSLTEHITQFVVLLKGLFGEDFTKKTTKDWESEFNKRNEGDGFVFKIYDELYGTGGASIGYLEDLLKLLEDFYGKGGFDLLSNKKGEMRGKGLVDYVLGGNGKEENENGDVDEWVEPGLMNTVDDLKNFDEEIKKMIEGYDYQGEYIPPPGVATTIGGYSSTKRFIGISAVGAGSASSFGDGDGYEVTSGDSIGIITPEAGADAGSGSNPNIGGGNESTNKVTVHNMGINDYLFGIPDVTYLSEKEGEDIYECKYLGLVPTTENIYKTLYGSNASLNDPGTKITPDYTSSWFGEDGLLKTFDKSCGRIIELEKITMGKKLSSQKFDYVENGEIIQVELREAGLKDYVLGGEGYKLINDEVGKWTVIGTLDKIDFLSTVLFNCQFNELTTQQIEKLTCDYSTDLGFLQYVENKLGGLYTKINGKIENHPSGETDENGKQIMVTTREPGMYDYIFGGEGQKVVDDELKSWAKIGLIEKIEGKTVNGGTATVMSTGDLPKAPLTHLIRGTEISVEPPTHILGIEDYLYGYKNTEELNLYDYAGNKIEGEYKGLIEKVDTGNKKLYEVLDCIEYTAEETGEKIYQPGMGPYLYGFTRESGTIVWYDKTEHKVEEKYEYKGLLKTTDEIVDRLDDADVLLKGILKGKTYMGPVEGEENDVEIYEPGILDYLHGYKKGGYIYTPQFGKPRSHSEEYVYYGVIEQAEKGFNTYVNLYQPYDMEVIEINESGNEITKTVKMQPKMTQIDNMMKDVYGYDTIEQEQNVHHPGLREKIDAFETLTINYQTMDESNTYECCFNLANDIFIEKAQQIFNSISSDIKKNYDDINTIDKELNGFTDTEGKYTKGLIEQTKRCLDTLFETEEEREMDIEGVPTMVKVYKPGLIDFINGFEYENGYIELFGQTVLVNEKISLESSWEFQNDINKLLYESQTLNCQVYDENGNPIDGRVKPVVKQPLLPEHSKMYNDIYGTDKYIAIYQKDAISGIPEQDQTTGQPIILRDELQHTKGILEKIETLEKSSFYYESSGGSMKITCTFNLSNDESFKGSLQKVFNTINDDIRSRVSEIKVLDNQLKEQFTYQDVNYNGVIPVLIDLNKKLYGYTDVEKVENENGEIIEQPKQVTGIIESLGKLQTNDNTTTPKINALEKKVDGYDFEQTQAATQTATDGDIPNDPVIHVMGINDYVHGTSEFKNLAESSDSAATYATFKGLLPTTNELVQQIYGVDKSMMIGADENNELLDTTKECLMVRVNELETENDNLNDRVSELENDLAVVTQKFNTLIEKLGGIVDGLDDNYKVPEDEGTFGEADAIEGGEGTSGNTTVDPNLK